MKLKLHSKLMKKCLSFKCLGCNFDYNMQKMSVYAQMSTELNQLALDHNILSNILSNVKCF